ncbi:MAG: HAMP domain-containing sensor histidine kinase [Lentisphaeria bacterium]|jgi:signal transduction histidine kinase|nr:HAMP domain-containing sensor histidine kinase [Lentisphaeria bacterium]
MLRSAYTWVIFSACLVAVVVAVGLISVTVLRLETAEMEAQRQIYIQERVRAALWRLESAAAEPLPDDSEPVPAIIELLPDGGSWKGHTAARLIEAARSAKTPPIIDQATIERLREDPTRDKIAIYQRVRNAEEWNARVAMAKGIGINRPVWLGEHLVRIEAGPNGSARVTVLETAVVKARLLAAIADLLPDATLLQVDAGSEPDRSRTLASLPISIDPGAVDIPPGRPTPIKLILTVAWSCMLLPALGIAILLFGSISLNERRAAFVSAVTHELRTPLTTFRMYAEMLHGGMVPESKRPEYLQTLRTEADRLSHLVENVLAYARLERGRGGRRLEHAAVGDVIEQVREQLTDLAARADMKLAIQIAPSAADLYASIDVSAVERIIFNLVDNACKYADGEGDRRIELSAEADHRLITVKVRDCGPGVQKADRKRLFQPFSKSAGEAADSAPGVGLGLALSRRLARAMGGNLTLDPEVTDGACFVLTLPPAPAAP